MKLIFSLLLCSLSFSSFAQRSEVRVGGVLSLFANSAVGDGVGGELYVGERWGAFSGGLNMQAVRTGHNGVYAPMTASLGVSAGVFTFHVDPGFLIHNRAIGKDQEKGRSYLGGGIRMTGEEGLYINLQYGKYHTKVDNGAPATSVGAISISVGYQFGGRG